MMRSSIVSQNSSGKVETSVISEEVPFNGDSGSVETVIEVPVQESCVFEEGGSLQEQRIARLVASLSLFDGERHCCCRLLLFVYILFTHLFISFLIKLCLFL